MGRWKKFEKNKTITKIKINSLRIIELRKFIEKLLKLNQKERREYMKSISDRELKFIKEIAYNIVKGTIPLSHTTYNKLKRVKTQLYSLFSKKFSNILFFSLKGLRILNIILPIALNYLLE